MQPGLTRAVPAGVLGFLGASLVVIIIRSLQGLDPIFDQQVGFVLGAFVSAFSFVWGMGALDPQMQQHPHAPEIDPETGLVIASDHDDEHTHGDEEAESEPIVLLGFSVWQVAFWTVVLFVVLFGLAELPTGLTMQISSDPSAQLSDMGSSAWTIPVLNVETQLSQGSILVMVIIAVMVGLVIVGGGIGWTMTHLNAGIKEVGELESTAMPVTPDDDEITARANALSVAEYIVFVGAGVGLFLIFYYGLVPLLIDSPNWLQIVISAVIAVSLSGNFTIRAAMLKWIGEGLLNVLVFLSLAFFLYIAFYFVLIGLPIASPDWLRISLSVVNAVGAAFTAVYPKVLVQLVGKQAAEVLKVLRGVPDALR